jgi:hypothetical protein
MKDKSHKHKHAGGGMDLKRSAENIIHTHSHGAAAEPIIGHHQNIGAHHLPAGAVPAGHNTAYDAALYNQSAGNPVHSHSVRDAELMKKMDEKKMARDEKMSAGAHSTVV